MVQWSATAPERKSHNRSAQPPHHRHDIPVALGIMRGLPTADVPPPPDQAVLDVIVGHAAA
jgi:hypothetical protein